MIKRLMNIHTYIYIYIYKIPLIDVFPRRREVLHDAGQEGAEEPGVEGRHSIV